MAAAAALDRYRRDVAQLPRLDAQDELTLAERWQAGDPQAARQLIEAHLGQVLRLAFEYRRWGIPLEDLVQQGNLGLLQAARRYRPELGTRLASYAAYWIRAEIRDYVVRMYRIVRLGTTRTERRAVRTFRAKRIDSVEGLSTESGMPIARCQQLWPLLTQPDVSLSTPTRHDQSPMELLDRAGRDPESLAVARQEQQLASLAVHDAMNELTDRERRILHARLMSDEPHTLEQLGLELGVSRERVRQIENRARDKLRSSLEQQLAVVS